MRRGHQIELERLGLSAVEAQIYLALLRKGGNWRASAVAATMQIPRSTVYLALNSLQDRGLLEAEAGYGGRFSAVPPERALPSLVAAEREDLIQREKELLERESVANDLAQELKSAASPASTDSGADLIQILRDPRVIAERFERLQLEAKRQVDVFVKAPIFVGGGNPAEERSMRKGVRHRGLYEKAVLDTPNIKPYLKAWIAHGEELRVFDGELPHKLALFDAEIVLMPLIRPGEQTKTVLIRLPQLAQSLALVFNHFWEKSEPIAQTAEPKVSGLTTIRNGHVRFRRKKQPKT